MQKLIILGGNRSCFTIKGELLSFTYEQQNLQIGNETLFWWTDGDKISLNQSDTEHKVQNDCTFLK